MARRRVYLHPIRWTSLGLSLLEAMHLGMPVVVLGTTEAYEAVPPRGGRRSRPASTCSTPRCAGWSHDPDEARARGEPRAPHVLARYGLERFLADWDELLVPDAEVAA